MSQLNGIEVKEEKIYKTYVDNLVVDPKKYNIRYEMPTFEQLQKMSNDIEHRGQLQPIQVIPIDGKLTVIVGFCRALAFQDLNDKEKKEGKDLTPIKFMMGDKKKALEELYRVENNIAENEVRFELSPMDKAYGMKRLYEDFKFEQKQIAEKYNVSQATVSNYLKLFELSKTIQKDVHDGTVSFSQALLLFKVPEEKRDEVVKEAKGGLGSTKLDNVPTGSGKREGSPRVNTGALKDAAGKVAKTQYSKSITDFKEFVTLEDSGEPDLSDSALKILNALFNWFSGTIDDKKLKKVLEDNSVE